MTLMRLDRFFSSQEILSRKEVKKLIHHGEILVNGNIVKSSDQKVDTQKDKISYRGNVIEYKPYIYIMLNKPAGVVSSTSDKINKTVIDLLPQELFRTDLFPAGRLDKDTTGFVLITNDGEFAHNMLSPKNHVKKFYLVELDGSIAKPDIELIERGAVLADGYICKPAQITLLEDTDNPLLEIVLVEGKYHQIKRMFGVIGRGVNSLKRVRIGNLFLDERLKEGYAREITNKEISLILDK